LLKKHKIDSNKISSVRMTDDIAKTAFGSRVEKHQYNISLIALFLGTIIFIGGLILFFHSLNGRTKWVVSFLGIHSELSDAPPGIVLCIIGLFVIYINRYSININKK
jgi:hypothetical protein